MRSWTLVVDCCGRPVLSNNRLHHYVKAQQIKPWREAGCVLARKAQVPRLRSVHIDVWGRYPNRKTPDVDAVAPTLKAVLDGIVDAGVIPDDKPPFVESITFWAPKVEAGKPPALIVRLTEPVS